jgi:hypothetical protein
LNSEDQRSPEEQHVFDLARELKPIFLLSLELWADVEAARAAMLSNDTQFARRQFVRAVFAALEGLTSKLKELCLRRPASYSPSERALLREEAVYLDDQGEARVAASHLKLGANIQFAFRMYARWCDVRFSLPTSDSEWSAFKRAIAVRNRLMHPRKLEDLTVSEAEVEAASRTAAWIAAKEAEVVELSIDKIAYKQGMTANELREFRAFRKQLFDKGHRD